MTIENTKPASFYIVNRKITNKKKPADNKRFCEIGGWSDNPNCGGYENCR